MAANGTVIAILFVASALCLVHVVMAQPNPLPADTPTPDLSAANPPPDKQVHQDPPGGPSVPQTLSRGEVGKSIGTTVEEKIMSIFVLILGLVVLLFEFLLLWRSKAQADDILRVLGVSLIIVAALFTVAAAFDVTQLTPVIGLLGTIAGYLIGKDGARAPVTAASSAPGSAAAPMAPASGGGAE